MIGTGTSLADFRFERLRGQITIGLNDALLIPGLQLTYALFCDTGIWKRYNALDLHPTTAVVCQTRSRDYFLRDPVCRFKDQVWHFNHVSTCCLSRKRRKSVITCKRDNDDLYVSRTVATGGIMLAYKLGARRVFILGVDGYKVEGSQPGGVYYWDGRGKGAESRKERGAGDATRPSGRVRDRARAVQDRHDAWRDNMRDLRAWFDHLGAYQEPYVLRDPETGQKRHGSNVFNLSGRSTIDAWQKVKVKTVLGLGCYKT